MKRNSPPGNITRVAFLFLVGCACLTTGASADGPKTDSKQQKTFQAISDLYAPIKTKRLKEAAFDEGGMPRLVTDATLYQEILGTGFLPRRALAHFPIALGEQARLAFMVPVMQGGTFLQVVEPATQEEMDALEAKYMGKMRLSEVPREDGHGNGMGHRPYSYFCGGPTVNPDSFPNEREVVMLVMEDHEGGFHWNHGVLAGVTFRRGLGQIIYWAEAW